jgi:uncharacterized protein YcfL
MRKKFIVLLLTSLLLTNCGSTQSIPKETKTKTEVVSGEKDPLMKLLVSALILYSLNLIITR